MRPPLCARFCLVLAVSAAATAPAFALTIDDFELGDHSIAAATGQTPASTEASASAIGGHRTIALSSVTASGAGNVTVSVEPGLVAPPPAIQGLLSHSQDVSSSGISTITWDGDGSSATDFDGLGGIDLTEDGGSAFRITVSQFDYPNLQPISLVLTVYDASDAAGSKRSEATLTLNAFVNALTTFEVTFASFAQSPGATGPADFSKVGAIQLKILGNSPAADLAITEIRTNGDCPLVPDIDGVVDSCGVCGGNEGSRDDCGICFGRNESMDSCGFCPEDPEYNQGICNDCADNPNGEAQIDECGICNGDGTSCCEEFVIPPIQTELDAGAKAQQFIIRAIAKVIERLSDDPADAALVDAARDEAFELQNRNWIISWTFPSFGEVCPESAIPCVTVSNQSLIDEYRQHSLTLRAIGRKVLKRLRELRGGKLRRKERKWRRLIVDQHTMNMDNLALIPAVWSDCAEPV